MNYSSQIQSILYAPPSYVNVTMINCTVLDPDPTERPTEPYNGLQPQLDRIQKRIQ